MATESPTATTTDDAANAAPAAPAAPPAAPITTLAAAAAAQPPDAPAAETKAAGEDKVAEALASQPFTNASQLKLPEGVQLDETAMKDFLPIAQKLGLTAAGAQALLEFDATRAAGIETARTASRDAARTAAVEALKADKELGGANWEASLKLAGRALQNIGSPELNKALSELRLEDGSMLGDSLVMAKVLVNLGKRVSEDTLGNTHGAGRKTAVNDERTFLNEMYPGTSLQLP